MKQIISLNYGAIRDTVFKYAGKQLMAEGGKSSTILNSFLQSVKKTPALKIQNMIFKNLEEGHFTKERLAERYIAQNIKLLENINWDKVINSNRDVRISLLENSHVEGESNKGELYEHIHTLLESSLRQGYTEIDKANQAYDFILNHLLRENVEVTP